jgi:hypothetical protein
VIAEKAKNGARAPRQLKPVQKMGDTFYKILFFNSKLIGPINSPNSTTPETQLF